ncbi:MAG: hypothetical protein HXY43_20815 [Fischerella sp.]|uniref:hypothetical protein n=1 Tax=Fischerella sp. TaxID=1191 RepID=UPI001791401B|nr:hypothetical protein [Fischerella sp.]NWF61623.1 hypothetical protein [Fischerella sp.]
MPEPVSGIGRSGIPLALLGTLYCGLGIGYYWRVKTKMLHYSFLVGWASSPSGACGQDVHTTRFIFMH